MTKVRRLSIFPLSGAVLFPGMHLPLHIFEPRYRALISDVLVRDRMIGMVQPRGGGNNPPLFDIGCMGKIAEVEAMEDGRYNILLEGVARFHIERELEVITAFRQVEASLFDEPEHEALAAVERAALEDEARLLADRMGYAIDWDAVSGLDDATLVNAIAQVAPFDAAAKQALLEAGTLTARADLAMQLMRFSSSRRDPGEDRATLQ
jgi:uncharacterized protein